MVEMRDPLPRNIILAIAVFFAAQCGLFSGLTALLGLPLGHFAAFAASSLAIHVLMLVFLLLGKEDFTIEATGQRLVRINLANILTLVRISTLPTLLFLIVSGRGKPILAYALVLSSAVFLTDLLDGFVSRRMRQGTKIGRMLDSISDYCLLGAFSIVLRVYALIEPWFFGLILGRLLFQSLGMTIFFFLHKPVPPRPTVFGKIAVASTMILYSLSILRPIAPAPFRTVFLTCEAIVSALILASIADKLVVFVRHAKRGATQSGA
jgi:phosphatidylglycerophosphate synthase